MKKDIDPNSVKIGAKEALEYVSWIVNPNKLFDAAMCTYDFELVTLVASQTQKDPKEYVPYLQALKQMDPIDMKFKIEADFKNYEKALQIVAEGGPKYFDKALELVQKQRLYKQALELYKNDADLHNQVKGAFGDYLMQRGYVQEAGFLYMNSESPEDLKKSLSAFKTCCNVDMCFSIAFKLEFDEDQVSELMKEVIEILASSHKYKEAADMLCQTEDYSLS